MQHTFARLVDHDPRSLDFIHFAAKKPLVKKSVRWTTSAPVLDQGEVGACTGNAMAQWINSDYATRARKTPTSYLTEADALTLYSLGTKLDGIPGNTYPPTDGGGSGLGVAKAAKQLGYIGGYHTTTTLDGFLAALQTQPLIVGTAFFEDMEDPNSAGIVKVGGALAGGHEYKADEIDYARDLVGFENSWSDQWGLKGRFYVKIEDFGKLLLNREMPGDTTIPALKTA